MSKDNSELVDEIAVLLDTHGVVDFVAALADELDGSLNDLGFVDNYGGDWNAIRSVTKLSKALRGALAEVNSQAYCENENQYGPGCGSPVCPHCSNTKGDKDAD